MNNQFSTDLFNRIPIIGIMRNVSHQHTEAIADIYSQSGLTCIEVTMNSANAEAIISSLINGYGDKLNIGAGTVLTMHDLEKALKAGAGFIVTPVVNEEVIKACAEQKIPVFPGAYTPTEIYKAWSLGATMVKVFPATTLGSGYIKELSGPLGHINLVPTGGISLDNFTAYFEAGAKAVGIGSHLFPKNILEAGDWETLGDIYTSYVAKYNAYNNAKA